MRGADLQREKLSEKERRSIEILEILRRSGPLSRPDISKEMGINVVTISNYLDEFVRSKLVLEKELDVSEGGRRPALLDLNPQGGYVIGVGLNLMSMVGLLVDIKGNIIAKTQIARPKASVKELAECTLDIIRQILKRSKEYTSEIRGVGIGMAGLINKKNWSVHWPQKTDHEYTYASVDLPLGELVEKEFNLPALIENDATCACFGEHWLDLNREYRNVIYMFSGVGCGIMINGEVYTGTNGYAGEVSIFNYKEEDLFSCASGGSCFLKRWELDLGIVSDVEESLGKKGIALKDVFSAARQGEPAAVAALDKAAKKLGIKVAYLVNLLNPEVVVIGGGLEEAGTDFLNKVDATVRSWAFRESTEGLKVIYSQLRENAVALGASSLLTRKIFAGIL